MAPAGRDLLAVADRLGLQRFHAAGNSVGGAITVEAELQRPGTIIGAVLFEPIIDPCEITEPSPMLEGARRRGRVFGSTDAMLQQRRGRHHSPPGIPRRSAATWSTASATVSTGRWS